MRRREFITFLGGAAALAFRGDRATASEAADHRIPRVLVPLRHRANGQPPLCSGCVSWASTGRNQ